MYDEWAVGLCNKQQWNEALAIYDKEPEIELEFRERRKRRWAALTAPHLYEYSVPSVAKALADRAAGEDREDVAAELRKFALEEPDRESAN